MKKTQYAMKIYRDKIKAEKKQFQLNMLKKKGRKKSKKSDLIEKYFKFIEDNMKLIKKREN